MSGLRVAELETLFTANIDQVEKADKQLKDIGQRAEKNPIKAEVTVDETGALAGMDRVEAQAKHLVSAKTMLEIDTEIEKSEAKVSRLEEKLESLEAQGRAGFDVTAATKRAEADLQKTQRILDRLRQGRTELELDADAQQALAAIGKVEAGQKRLVSASTVARIDADIEHAQRNVARFEAELVTLQSKEPTVQVLAEIGRAESKLKEVQGRLDDLKSARATIEVDADTSPAEGALEDAVDVAGEAGQDAGGEFGTSVIAALASIPIAGAIAGIAAAAGKLLVSEFQDSLQLEVGRDRLQALTGIDETSAIRLGMIAGEAYTNAFGESIEANMDTTRLALQFDLIDEQSSTRDAQKVVSSLAGIADVLGEDVRPVAAAVTTLLSSGVVKSADQAFDLIATGAREGVNRNEDLLDTLTEYPALFSRLGLSGEEALGLISQGMKAGARNSDLAADALKEFQIRATDASESSSQGFRLLGLDAEEMTAKIARGGDDAREGLDQVLDKLRETEDPVARNAAAVALFGTQAEDLGEALFAMDLSNAVEQLDGVTGSAQRMFDTMSNNDATKLVEAQRNIEVAADGIKAALAAGFAEPLGMAADWVSQNRGPVMEFLSDMVNGAIDFGITMVEGAADSTEALGTIVSGPLASLIEGFITLQKVINPLADTSDLEGLVDDMKSFDETATQAAEVLRTDFVAGLETARSKANGILEPAVALGYLNDATRRVADSLSDLGYTADGTMISLLGVDTANLSASESGRRLEDQLTASTSALNDELAAAIAAGDGQEALADRYAAGTQAIVDQLVQMGLTEDQAWELVNAYNSVPGEKRTTLADNSQERIVQIDGLSYKITTLPDKTVTITADTSQAETAIANLIRQKSGFTFHVSSGGPVALSARGNLFEFMRDGGLRSALTPMQSVAQMVPPNTWRVVGDRGDVEELYAPLDGSARSWALIFEALRRMPGTPPQMAAGDIVGQAGSARSRGSSVVIEIRPHAGQDVNAIAEAVWEILEGRL